MQLSKEQIELLATVGSEVIVGILRRRAAAKSMDVATLIAEASVNSTEVDTVLDRIDAKVEASKE